MPRSAKLLIPCKRIRENREISRQFTDVITGVTSVSDDAMQDIRDLKESSAKVETQFAEIHKIYDEFQTRFDEIHATMQNIVGIANQTNLLALNASIEAAVPVNTEKDLPLLQMKSQNFPLASKNWWVM